ncbi:sulfur carrier protein ThiS [Litoribacillus peritrichatus]|uniref:Thiamine biosynthesis protein ThiS n=1 Tax=Litoribacillus peritrichatus TaxID=718191 RepID=A0ABP7MJR9_9GAMM
MEVLVNGETTQVNATHLVEVLKELGFEGDFAVAINGEFVPRSMYAEQTLAEGNQLDVLSPIAGG